MRIGVNNKDGKKPQLVPQNKAKTYEVKAGDIFEGKEVKKKGKYLVIDTNTEGIKKVLNMKGGYLVNLDYGTKDVVNEDGSTKTVPVKSSKVVRTEKEAKILRSEAESIRNGFNHTWKGKPVVVKVPHALDDFLAHMKKNNAVGDETYVAYANIAKHVKEYFVNSEPKDITKLDIESYYEYQMKNGNRNPCPKGMSEDEAYGISINTIPKHKSFLKKFWNFMIDKKAYGVSENIITRTEIPKKTKIIDGKEIIIKQEDYNITHLTIEQLNYTLNDAIQNELDRSIVVLIGLSAIGTLRSSEIQSLRLCKYYHNELMEVSDEILEYGGYIPERYRERDDLMLIDTAMKHSTKKESLPKCRKVRVAAVPNVLKEIVEFAMEQRREIYKLSNREIDNQERVYIPFVNLFKGMTPKYLSLDKKWKAYQKRRDKRMMKAGLEPIGLIRLHDLRHTFNNISVDDVPDYQRSYNMGHTLKSKTTTERVYLNDSEMRRDKVIKFFDENIKIDWDKKMVVDLFNPNNRAYINNSGHIIISSTEIQDRKNHGRKFIYSEDEIATLLANQEIDHEDRSAYMEVRKNKII